MWVEKHGNRYRVLDRDDGRKYTVRSFETEAEALMFAGAQRSPVEGFSFIPMPKLAKATRRTTPAVGEYGQLLIDSPSLRPSSRYVYMKALRKIEDSPLGRMQLHEVGPVDIRQFDNALKTDRSNTILFLRKIFRAARREGTITNDPAEQANLKRPKAKQKKIKPLTLAEVDQLAAKTLNDQEALWVRIGAYAGLRGGETGALRLEDIDFTRCRIDVVQNSTTVGSERGLGEPEDGVQCPEHSGPRLAHRSDRGLRQGAAAGHGRAPVPDVAGRIGDRIPGLSRRATSCRARRDAAGLFS